MEDFKGTKGEWKDALTPMRKSKVVDSNAFSICTLSAGTPTDRANAKLIAAAPELLEALQYLLKTNTIDRFRCEQQDAIIQAEAAINKALSH